MPVFKFGMVLANVSSNDIKKVKNEKVNKTQSNQLLTRFWTGATKRIRRRKSR
jgi:hypothetical protein